MRAFPDLRRGDSAASQEGTLAHELLEATLRSGIGKRANTGNASLDDSVNVCAGYVAEVTEMTPDIEWSFEHPVKFPQDVIPREDCGTIIDILGYSPSRREGWVIDFKHGIVHVAAVENTQLLFGATAAFWDRPVGNLTLAIVQPNGFIGSDIKEFHVTSADILEFRQRVCDALEEVIKPNAPLTPGKHCKYCPAEPVCLAREEEVLREMTGATARNLPVDEDVYEKVVDMSVERKAAIKRAAPAIKAWLATVESAMTAEALAGTVFPGFKLVEATARRRWSGTPQEIADRLIEMSNHSLDLDAVMPRELISITAIEPRLAKITAEHAVPGKKKDASAAFKRDFASLTEKTSSGALTLVPEEDRKPAVTPAAKDFEQVEIETPTYVE